jgi:hypothetical protein
MRDVAKDAYDNIEVGAIGWIRPDAGKGETLEGFQAVARAAEIMQQDGFIWIRSVHKESATGRQLVDAIQFMKMR